MYICWRQQCREAHYFGLNFIVFLMEWRVWYRTHYTFWKNLFFFVKGASNIDTFFHISYMHLIDSVCDIILLTNEVLFLGKFLLSLQDQNQTFSGIKFAYSWCFNEQKWKSYKPFVLKWHWKPKIGEYFYFLKIVLIIYCYILLWCIWY